VTAGAFAEDLERYPPRAAIREQSIWAVAVYRFGRWGDRQPSAVVRWLADRAYWLAFRVVETAIGVSFTKATAIGPGLRIHHFGGVFVNERARIGARCTMRQGVTIGSLTDDGPAPVLGDDVELGAYAQVLGGVRIGDGARIGAMAVVLRDVPAGATAVGVPAQVVLRPTAGRRHRARLVATLDGVDDRGDADADAVG
jgi:serine O-acetyltransferase